MTESQKSVLRHAAKSPPRSKLADGVAKVLAVVAFAGLTFFGVTFLIQGNVGAILGLLALVIAAILSPVAVPLIWQALRPKGDLSATDKATLIALVVLVIFFLIAYPFFRQS